MAKTNKKFWIIISLSIVIIGIIGLLYFIKQEPITFTVDVAKIEIHGTYDAKQYIKEVRNNRIDEVHIDASQVNVEQLGQYEIKYKLKDKAYNLKVNVVDTTAPTYDIQSLELALGVSVKAEDFVKDIKDQTQTKVYFVKEQDFKNEGEYKISIVVEDEGGNKVQKETTLKLVKDTEKPILVGLQDYKIVKGMKVDYLKGVSAVDNLDPKPTIKVDSSQVNLSKEGTYNIKYTVMDQSGNQNVYTKTVMVSSKQKIMSVPENKKKIVYLTFDDGPSPVTDEVLKVLDKYGVKATFFVTGNGQKYNYLIKKAHDQGHTIALHTYTHQYSKIYASTTAYFNDLDKVGKMVEGIIGHFPKYIRFPGGASNTVSRHYSKGIMSTLTKEVQRRGYQYYDWNVSSGDASGNNVAVSKLVRNATSSHASNINILLHDIASKKTTPKALPQIIEHYKALGYTFKGIDDSAFSPHQHVNN